MDIYGIDLGTTNSLIALNRTGYISPLIPSCVDLETGSTGSKEFDNMGATRSYKVDMSMGTEGIKPRLASKFVLKEVVRQVGNKVTDVVISVPAYFSDSQRSATIAAAESAGLKVHALVNEPTAAAMYIAQEKKGVFVVFDLGGGTFDCTIIDSRFGTFDVQATGGLTIGGDNFDELLSRHFITKARIPIHKLNKEMILKLKHFAAKLKIRMQKERAPFEIDFAEWMGNPYTFTPEAYKSLMKTAFAKTIDLTVDLVKKWVPDEEACDVLLVGGSTHCPYLREWIEESINRKTAPLTYDPDRVVALGAALYAELVEKGELLQKVSDVTKQLSIGLHDGTVSAIIFDNSKVPLSVEKMFSNATESDQLSLKLYQGSNMFAKDNECIGELVWNYDEVKAPYMGQVLVTVSIDISGVITFSAGEILKEPKVVVLNRLD